MVVGDGENLLGGLTVTPKKEGGLGLNCKNPLPRYINPCTTANEQSPPFTGKSSSICVLELFGLFIHFACCAVPYIAEANCWKSPGPTISPKRWNDDIEWIRYEPDVDPVVGPNCREGGGA